MIAIFVIIIISLLAASLVSLQRDSAEGASFEVYAARAYLAALSANELALTEIFPVGVEESPGCANVTARPVLNNIDGAFHACQVENQCLPTLAGDRYGVISTAECASGEVRSRKVIRVEVAVR